MKRLGAAILLSLVVTLAIASPSDAAGGTSLKAAPFLESGHTYVANFSSDRLHDGNAEFWKARLLSGDDLSLNGTRNRQARYLMVQIFPEGTDDSTLARRRPLYEGRLNTLVQVAASQAGTYPVEITCRTAGRCGAIRFQVSITHQVSLYVPRSARLGLTGTFTVIVRTPSGEPLTSRGLVISLYGLWSGNGSTSLTHHVLGSATTVDGKADVSYRLPTGLTGKTIALQATSAGFAYRAASSSLCSAKVA
jgi:hypothetical protein